MARYRPEPAHVHGTPARIGVVLVNLGTPAAPTAAALRPYLKQFLSDPRVVEIPRLIWWPILHGIILNTRPAKSAQKYASVWMEEGSPLKVHTERQARLLAGHLDAHTPERAYWHHGYQAALTDVMAMLALEGERSGTSDIPN